MARGAAPMFSGLRVRTRTTLRLMRLAGVVKAHSSYAQKTNLPQAPVSGKRFSPRGTSAREEPSRGTFREPWAYLTMRPRTGASLSRPGAIDDLHLPGISPIG